jgi:hypothetical protein
MGPSIHKSGGATPPGKDKFSMDVLHVGDGLNGHRVLYGVASWANRSGNPNARSVKFEWINKSGKRARGGGDPVEALPAVVKVALEPERLGL